MALERTNDPCTRCGKPISQPAAALHVTFPQEDPATPWLAPVGKRYFHTACALSTAAALLRAIEPLSSLNSAAEGNPYRDP